MNRIVFCLLLILPVAGCKTAKNSSGNSSTIRILSYNVKNCNGMDEVTDYGRVAAVIKRIDADVVALQELDSATIRSKGVVVLDTLAVLTGMYQVYGASIDYQGGKYGIGVLSREKPLGSKRVALPGREERRSVLMVEFPDYILGCTHFSLTEEDRLNSVPIVTAHAASCLKPVFLAGDLNARPSSEVLKDFSTEWITLNDTADFTVPPDKPARCIDYVLGLKSDDHDFRILKSVVGNEPVASDHLPVWVEVELR